MGHGGGSGGWKGGRAGSVLEARGCHFLSGGRARGGLLRRGGRAGGG